MGFHPRSTILNYKANPQKHPYLKAMFDSNLATFGLAASNDPSKMRLVGFSRDEEFFADVPRISTLSFGRAECIWGQDFSCYILANLEEQG